MCVRAISEVIAKWSSELRKNWHKSVMKLLDSRTVHFIELSLYFGLSKIQALMFLLPN